jgi:hypothetical protein
MAKMFILDNSKIKNGGGLEYKKKTKTVPQTVPLKNNKTLTN